MIAISPDIITHQGPFPHRESIRWVEGRGKLSSLILISQHGPAGGEKTFAAQQTVVGVAIAIDNLGTQSCGEDEPVQ